MEAANIRGDCLTTRLLPFQYCTDKQTCLSQQATQWQSPCFNEGDRIITEIHNALTEIHVQDEQLSTQQALLST